MQGFSGARLGELEGCPSRDRNTNGRLRGDDRPVAAAGHFVSQPERVARLNAAYEHLADMSIGEPKVGFWP